MDKAREVILCGVLSYINDNGGCCSKWYCGVASSIEEQLFTVHNLPRKDQNLRSIWYKCANDIDARYIMGALKRLGCDSSSVKDGIGFYIYAYLKQKGTKP